MRFLKKYTSSQMNVQHMIIYTIADEKLGTSEQTCSTGCQKDSQVLR